MSCKSLNSEKGKRIQNKIERQQRELSRSVGEIKDSIHSAVDSATEVVNNPLSLIIPSNNEMKQNKLVRLVIKHPIPATIIFTALGWTSSRILIKRESNLSNFIKNSSFFLIKSFANSSTVNSVASKINSDVQQVMNDVGVKFVGKARSLIDEIFDSTSNHIHDAKINKQRDSLAKGEIFSEPLNHDQARYAQ